MATPLGATSGQEMQEQHTGGNLIDSVIPRVDAQTIESDTTNAAGVGV